MRGHRNRRAHAQHTYSPKILRLTDRDGNIDPLSIKYSVAVGAGDLRERCDVTFDILKACRCHTCSFRRMKMCWTVDRSFDHLLTQPR